MKKSTKKIIAICTKAAAIGIAEGVTSGIIGGVSYDYMINKGRKKGSAFVTAMIATCGVRWLYNRVTEDMFKEDLKEFQDIYEKEIEAEHKSKFGDVGQYSSVRVEDEEDDQDEGEHECHCGCCHHDEGAEAKKDEEEDADARRFRETVNRDLEELAQDRQSALSPEGDEHESN